MHLDQVGLRQTARLHAAQRRSPRRLGYRKGVIAVVLVAFDERLDVLRRNQPQLGTELLQRPAPVVGTAASFHGNSGLRIRLQERQ